MNDKICCFTGHRKIPDNDIIALPDALDAAISEFYEKGAREFRAGGAIGFDTLAALKVISFRRSHPDVRLSLILPCRDQDARWGEFDRETYRYTIESADSVIYTGDSYTKGCMHRRNRSLVSGSDFCIAYVKKEEGGSAYTLKLAVRAGLEIINLADALTE